MISCYRKQYAVGQGGLHLGKIYYTNSCKDKRTFAYLYDCGCSNGMNSMKDDIDDIIEYLDPELNLVGLYIYLSHAHSDHINGMTLLAKKLRDLNIRSTIILPFMEDAEKIVTVGGQNELNDLSTNLILDPQHMADFGNVVYLNDSPSDDLDMSNYDNYLMPFGTRNMSHNTKIIFKDSYEQWVLIPFYNKIKPCLLDNLNNELKLYGITIDNFTEKRFATRLREIYRKYKIDLNFSSLCLYSGTLNKINHTHTGWLHTGDINLLNEFSFNNFSNHYRDIQDNVRVMQIPHHGSIENSRINRFDNFPNINNYFITTQNKPNGRSQPNVSGEYLNNENIILLRESSFALWSYERTNGIVLTNFCR